MTPEEEAILKLKNTATEGRRARDFMASDYWGWFEDKIIGAMKSVAESLLIRAKTDEQRIEAQQKMIAAHDIKRALMHLDQEGKNAAIQLSQISTLEEGE